MRLIIDIPEKLVCEGFERLFTEEEKNTLIKAIGNGTPLPKGHGCLIDKDALIGRIHGVRSITAVLDAPVIIEADRGYTE